MKLRYSWRQVPGDMAGGAIAALIALPYGLALAAMMGLPPVLGLFTSILTAPVTAALGRNPLLIGGTASATVPFIAHAVAKQGVGGAAKVCLAAAVFLLVFSSLKLGRYIVKVPGAVVSGFSCGIGAMMVITQLKTFTGIPLRIDAGSSNTLAQLIELLPRLEETRWPPLLLGCAVIAGAWASAKWIPRAPAPLIGLLSAVGLAGLFGIHEKVVGYMELEIPAFAGFTWKPTDVTAVLPEALGLALITSVNLLITSRVVEHFRGRHQGLKRVDADKELSAYGIANLCAAFFGAPMSVGIPARSLAAVRCGGTTRLTNLFHGIFLVLCLLLGSDVISQIPLPALAGITAYMGLCLLDWSTWRRLPLMRRVDAAAFLVTALAILTVNAVAAVALGCSLYGARALWRKLSGDGRAFLPQESRSGMTRQA